MKFNKPIKLVLFVVFIYILLYLSFQKNKEINSSVHEEDKMLNNIEKEFRNTPIKPSTHTSNDIKTTKEIKFKDKDSNESNKDLLKQVVKQSPLNTNVAPVVSSLTEDKRNFYQTKFFSQSNHGIYDGEKLVEILSVIYAKHLHSLSQHRLVIDIGANVGKTSSKFMYYLTDHQCRQLDTHDKHKHVDCWSLEKDLIVIAFEPMPFNFKHIELRAKQLGWYDSNYMGVEAAVGKENGNVTFYSIGTEGDEQASQDANAAFVNASNTDTKFTIPMVSLDKLFETGLAKNKSINVIGNVTSRSLLYEKIGLDIFYLKIDAEGYDYYILDGGYNLLKSKRVKFLTFEYNGKWFTDKRTTTLKQVTGKMYKELGYECYWILKDSLVPVFGEWWQDNYEIRTWSNLFCGITNDSLLKWIVESVNGMPS